jgi:hypothetical protein
MDIAKKLGLTVGAAKSRLFTARGRVGKLLKPVLEGTLPHACEGRRAIELVHHRHGENPYETA